MKLLSGASGLLAIVLLTSCGSKKSGGKNNGSGTPSDSLVGAFGQAGETGVFARYPNDGFWPENFMEVFQPKNLFIKTDSDARIETKNFSTAGNTRSNPRSLENESSENDVRPSLLENSKNFVQLFLNCQKSGVMEYEIKLLPCGMVQIQIEENIGKCVQDNLPKFEFAKDVTIRKFNYVKHSTHEFSCDPSKVNLSALSLEVFKDCEIFNDGQTNYTSKQRYFQIGTADLDFDLNNAVVKDGIESKELTTTKTSRKFGSFVDDGSGGYCETETAGYQTTKKRCRTGMSLPVNIPTSGEPFGYSVSIFLDVGLVGESTLEGGYYKKGEIFFFHDGWTGKATMRSEENYPYALDEVTPLVEASRNGTKFNSDELKSSSAARL